MNPIQTHNSKTAQSVHRLIPQLVTTAIHSAEAGCIRGGLAGLEQSIGTRELESCGLGLGLGSGSSFFYDRVRG